MTAPHPPRLVLRLLRPICRGILWSAFRLQVHGADHVPGSGPVILASNHLGVIDGPLVATCAPRPVHALTKAEMFRGRLGGFLAASGQISLDRYHPDPGALKTCLRVLGDGGVVGIFPEGVRGDGELHRFHHGAAYLALRTGAPVVPVTLVGTRAPGGGADSIPAWRSRLDISFGEPWQVPAQRWPRRRAAVLTASSQLLSHMQAHQKSVLAQLGRTLPGPLPAGQPDGDPDTGFIDSQAGTA